MKKKISITIDEKVYARLQEQARITFGNISRVVESELRDKNFSTDIVKNSNPYPADIFTEMSHEDWVKATQALESAGLSPDRIFGNWGRKVWDDCIETIKRELEKD